MRRRLDLRRLRLRAVWLLIIPFYIYASPTTILIWSGAGVSTAGLALRAWAAGSIQKDHELATTGPYAHTRNPLYLGSFILGVGVTVAGGQWMFGVAFLAFFLVVLPAGGASRGRRVGGALRRALPSVCSKGALGAATDHRLPRRVVLKHRHRKAFSRARYHAEPGMGGGARSGCGIRRASLEAETLALKLRLRLRRRSLTRELSDPDLALQPPYVAHDLLGPSRLSRRGGAPCPRIASDGPARRFVRRE